MHKGHFAGTVGLMAGIGGSCLLAERLILVMNRCLVLVAKCFVLVA